MRSLLCLLMLCAAVPAATQEMPSRDLPPGMGTPRATQALQLVPRLGEVLDLSSQVFAKRKTEAAPRRGVLRVGAAVDIADAERTIAWQPGAAGGAVGQLLLSSRGARGLRAELALPAGLMLQELRAAASNDAIAEHIAGPVHGATVWTPYTDGELQVIELHVAESPTAATQAGPVRIAALMHFEISPLLAQQTLAKEQSGSCNPDVACSTGTDALDLALIQRKRSVTLLNFRSGPSSSICTATLINSDKFPRAFLLTAEHCISTVTEANSVSSIWFRENSQCGALDTAEGQVQIAGGAQLRLANFMVDSTLLELNAAPPDGVSFAGWNAVQLATNSSIVSISHPRGDPMKFALGSVEGLIRPTEKPYDMYAIHFTRGVIESGSSGSGLFVLSEGSLQLRGVLLGTTANEAGDGLTCSNLTYSGLYGRFDVFYGNIKHIISNFTRPATDIDANEPTGARVLPLGGSLDASIDYAGDIDYFQLNITQAGNVTVYTTGGNDTVGAFLAGNGAAFVAEDDAETKNNEFGITWRVTPGTYYVAVAHFVPAQTANYTVHATFSTATENYSDIWSNANESGWGLALNHQDNTLAGALYTYAADGTPLFLIVNGATRQADGSYVGPLVRYAGPAFNTMPWPVTAVVPTNVGSMRIVFSDRTHGQITYTVDGVTVTKAVTRLVFDEQPNCTFSGFDRSFTRNFQDIWWNPSESGWGLNIIHQGDIITAGLYTYDMNGRNVWYLMAPGIRQGFSSLYRGDLSRYTGPAFNSNPWPATAVAAKVGTMSIDFSSGNRATLAYDIGGVTVSKTIERLVFATPRTSCEEP